MLLTTADLRDWIGRAAMDPYGAPLGEVAGVLTDIDSGAPEWLVLTDPGADEGRVVPLAGAVPTGRQIRVVPTAERVEGAPETRVGEDLDETTKQRAATHYGLRLDRDSSASGLLRDPPASENDGDGAVSHGLSKDARRELVDGLRAAHAMEQASLKLLNAMRWRGRDAELVHDIALHHKATNDHAEQIRLRLDELEASRALPLRLDREDGRLPRGPARPFCKVPEPADVEEAIRFEQAEAKAYRALRRLAEEAGDEATAKLCRANLADEEAMVMTLRKFRLRSDPGFRRGGESPFETPPELAEQAPES